MKGLKEAERLKPWQLGALLHYAMRYAMGRFTYAVDDVCMMMREQWPSITDSDRKQIATDLNREIRRVEERGEVLGGTIQHQKWRDLRDWMTERNLAITAHTEDS